MSGRPLRVGMVGGGPGGFIGDVHRRALRLDGLYNLVAGVFSRDASKSAEFGATLGISPQRLYLSAEEMASAEAELPPEQRIEVAVIVTPTPSHAAGILAFASRGFAVVCDKPLCSSLKEADTVIAALASNKTPFMLIHNYSGYPMVKQARHLVVQGAIGEVTKVIVEYEQGWLCEQDQLSSTGSITSLADVGTHALQLLQYVTGLSVTGLCADCATMVGGPRSPDDNNVLLRLSGGRRGVLIASQASSGQGNGLRLRVYGAKGGLLWEQEAPERLQLSPCGEPAQVHVRGGQGLCAAAQRATRTPLGHPEGFTEAFANLYTEFHRYLSSKRSGIELEAPDFPTAADGRAGLAFVEACLRSSKESAWLSLPGSEEPGHP